MKEIRFDTNKKVFLGNEQEIIECFLKYKNKRDDASLVDLIKCMKPTFKLWAKIIKKNSYEKDFTIYSLYRFLDADNKPVGPVEIKIKNYLTFLKQNQISVYDDIVYLFLEYLNKELIQINYYKESYYKRFIYHVAMEMKYLLFKRIRTINQLFKREITYAFEQDFDKNAIALIDTKDYSIFVDTEILTIYERYFLVLVNHGFTFTQRMHLMHNSKKQQLQEEEQLWLLLKKKLSDK